MVNKLAKQHKKSLYKRIIKWLVWVFGVLALLAGIVYVAFQVSPWPSALLVRAAFDKNAAERVAALQKYLPANVSSTLNQQYKTGDKDAYLDVYYPTAVVNTGKVLPTVVWVHGGGWISGDKANVDPYLQILASKGYTVIGINYSIAPEKTYPTPVVQTNEALAYIQQHAAVFHADMSQIVLAGDSAGSQIAAQIATIVTNPAYAKTVGITPTIGASQLAGMLLTCGAYNLSLISTNGNSEGAKLLKTFLWAYSGDKNFMSDPAFLQASVAEHVTKDFPPSFITAGNDDPLLSQSQSMAQKLQALGVTVDQLFYPANYSPALPHEYQFNLDDQAGQQALQQVTTFLGQHTRVQ